MQPVTLSTTNRVMLSHHRLSLLSSPFSQLEHSLALLWLLRPLIILAENGYAVLRKSLGDTIIDRLLPGNRCILSRFLRWCCDADRFNRDPPFCWCYFARNLILGYVSNLFLGCRSRVCWTWCGSCVLPHPYVSIRMVCFCFSHILIMLMLKCLHSSPKWIRGAVVSTYQWAITIGLLIAAVVNNATQNRDDASAYRLPIAIQFVWAAVLAGGMALLPEVNTRYIFSNRDILRNL